METTTTANDEIERSRYLVKKFGHEGVVDLLHPSGFVPGGAVLVIPAEYRVKDKRNLLSIPSTLRHWVESGCDGAGYYKTGAGRYEYFIPVYTEQSTPLGLIPLPSLARDKDSIKVRDDSPVYPIAAKACKPGYYPSLAPIEPEADGVAITSGFGFRHRDRRNHSGVDIQAPKDTPIRASAKGKVARVGYRPGSAGYFVVLDHGRGIHTIYAHLAKESISIKTGDAVFAGQIIANVGNSGRVRGKNGGYHLHFELRQNGKAIDPERGYSMKQFLAEGSELGPVWKQAKN
jgi:murein DD-endopeptidase MepM/ murein hydrolase activator NlpD